MNEEILRKKILGCWHGKNIGGTLGGPCEGFPVVNHLTFYDPVPEGAIANDDLELQAMYAAALDEMERVEISRDVLADIWLRHMNFHVDEYGVAMKNLSLGIRPPWSGVYDNHFTDGMGAAIRSELWACLAPGNPRLAAEFAREDSCIDHAGAGADAEIFFAALESGAFAGNDLRLLIADALKFLPEDSALGESIRRTCELWEKHRDWRTVRDLLFERYATEFRTSVEINIPFTVLALLSGGGDFGKTICDAANCGMDTDCTAATAGAILGILNPDGIPAEWLAPVGHKLIVRESAVRGLRFPETIEAFTEQILNLRKRLIPSVKTYVVPEPDWTAFQVPAEYSMKKNLHWYHVNLREQNWTPIRLPMISGSLEVPEEFRGNGGQIVLRYRFELPADGVYTVLFNTPTSCQVYLDPESEDLHDDRDMLFGRQRLFLEREIRPMRFRCADRPQIFNPTPGGAPQNQVKRYLKLSRGMHMLIIALAPLPSEERIYWGMGIAEGSRFLTGIFR